jgi:hypothetical protein
MSPCVHTFLHGKEFANDSLASMETLLESIANSQGIQAGPETAFGPQANREIPITTKNLRKN